MSLAFPVWLNKKRTYAFAKLFRLSQAEAPSGARCEAQIYHSALRREAKNFTENTQVLKIINMSKLEEVFFRLQNLRKEQKKIKSSYRDALSNSSQYQNALEDLKSLKEKKKKIEDAVREDFSSEFNRLENLKASIENDNELLSDIALNNLLNGQNVEITDKDNVQYEPIFSIKYKKSK
jgi:conjugal transfer/entry exclusion protein